MLDVLPLTRTTPAVQGWFHHGDKILSLLEQHRPKVCVELGSWLGASAIPVARSIRRWGGTLACIDTWSGNAFRADDEAQSPIMLSSCARNVVQADVSGTIHFIAAATLEAARWWTQPIDYLYVDADHSYEAVLADLRAWVPHVKPNGLIVGDDYDHPHFPGVSAAWDHFAFEQRLTLTRHQSSPPHPDGLELIYGTV